MTEARQDFIATQQRMLDRYGIEAESRFVDVPVVEGQAHVLVSGEGSAVMIVNGIGIPAAMWAPLMAELGGFRLFAVDLPAYGLTDTTLGFAEDLRRNAVRFLDEVLDGLGLESPAFLANSLGSLWTNWLALDRPERVKVMVHVGCPAIVLDTSAPLPMRLLSARPLGRVLTRLRPPSESQVEELSRMVNEYPLTPELADLILATERLPDFRHTFLSMLNALLRLRGSRPAMRLTAEQLTRVTQPTLVFWGQDDPFGSVEVGERMVKAMPDAELHVVGGGHAPWLTQAERIGPIVMRFLRQHE
ncbi:MAG: alpha/beta hydrolase [Gemmatimonadetes bacterium]|nr:alpha/beta hydrolase [Gemmatimonadota bacterium]